MLRVLALLLLVSAVTGTARGDDRLGVGVSLWGLLDGVDSTAVRVTYEFAENPRIWDSRLLLGGMYDFDDDAFYASGGWLKEWTINRNWSWGIGGELGYYSGELLGDEIQFFTRIVLNRHFSESGLLRAEVGHISNAGLGDSNPGSEVFGIVYIRSF